MVKLYYRLLTLLCALSLLCGWGALAAGNGVRAFPEGVLVIPMGTKIAINDDVHSVTIDDYPVALNEGDTFVVYLQDLPIGYVAKSVKRQGESTVVTVDRADGSVYRGLRESGEVTLTEENCEFIPAGEVRSIPGSDSQSSGEGGRFFAAGSRGAGFSFSDGKLTIETSIGGCSVTVELSNLRLNHSLNTDGSISSTLSGNWRIQSLPSASSSSGDIPLGELRIAGVGKIGLSLSVSMDIGLKADLGGAFSAGFAIENGKGKLIKSFSAGKRNFDGKGNFNAGLKVTAGVDLLVAAADVYCELGAASQYTFKSTYHEDTEKTVVCDDYRFYLFSTVGAEARYFSLTQGKMQTLPAKNFELAGEDQSPLYVSLHFEDGNLVGSCTQGMEVVDQHHGGATSSFESMLGSGSHIMETSVALPYDMVIDGDFQIANGTLNLNGNNLTINGDLIQSGGSIVIGKGTLNVKGNYRIQTPNAQSNGRTAYSDSTGKLYMSDSSGSISIGQHFYIQTSEWINLGEGTVTVNGMIEQIDDANNEGRFNTSTGFKLVMAGADNHLIKMKDADDSGIGHLVMEDDVSVIGDIRLGIVDFNGHILSVQGDLVKTYGTMNLESGILKITGNLLQTDGTMNLDNGKLTVPGNVLQMGGTMDIGSGELIIDGDYYIAYSRKVNDDGVEEIIASHGKLKMTNEAGIVRVGGNFLTKGDSVTYSMTAGTMYVAGDFTQLYFDARNFNATGSHRVVLNGSKKQKIFFQNVGFSGFANVTFLNKDIEFASGIRGFLLNDDINVTISSPSFAIYGTLNLNGHKLRIQGNLLQTNGEIYINKGELDVTGDYYIAGSRTVNDDGVEETTPCEGMLFMPNDADIVRVGGSFLAQGCGSDSLLHAGVMYVAGDFTQRRGSGDPKYPNINEKSFNAVGRHRVVLNGSKKQIVSFENYGYSGFATLEITKPLSWYSFDPDPCWKKLVQTFGTPNLILPAKLKEIEASAFEGIAATIVDIPDSCTRIADYAFQNSSVQQIRVPEKCIIGTDVFNGCDQVLVFGVAGSSAEEYCKSHGNCTFVSR